MVKRVKNSMPEGWMGLLSGVRYLKSRRKVTTITMDEAKTMAIEFFHF